MSESTDRKLILPAGDSRLNEFIRRAGPIVTAERGLNERSRLKLRSLASSLKMPDALFDLALEYFQQSGIEPKDSLTRFERAYWNWLHKHFRDGNHKILSTNLEQACLEHGTDKHQLKPERAGQLIHEVAREMNMQRVSIIEAESYLRELVLEQVGSATVLNQQLRERLHRAASSWGVEPDTVDGMVDAQLSENSKTGQSSNSKRTIGLGLCAIFIGASLFLLSIYHRSTIKGNNTASPVDQLVEAPQVDDVEIALHPNWNEATAENFLAAKESNGLVEAQWEVLVAEDNEQLLNLLGNLRRKAVGGERQDVADYVEFQSLALQAEQVESVIDRQIEVIANPMIVSYSELPKNAGTIKQTFLSNEIAFAVWNSLDESIQKNRLAKQMYVHSWFDPAAWNDASSTDNYLQLSNQSLARQWLDAFAGLAHETPVQAAELVAPIHKVICEKLPRSMTDSRINEAILSILSVEPALLPELRDISEEILSGKDSERFYQWTDLLWTTQDNELRNWLSSVLAEKLDVDPKLETKSRIAAIRKRLNRNDSQPSLSRNRIFVGWAESDQLLHDLINCTDVPPANAQLILNASNWATQALALSMDRNHQFNRMLTEKQLTLFDLAKLDLAAKSSLIFGNASQTPHVTHRETLSDAIASLASDSSNSNNRLNAFRRIVALGDRFDELAYPKAEVLIKYLFEANSDSEVILIRQELASIGHWLNLRLALMYELDSTKASRDQVLTIANLLVSKRIDIESSEDWKKELYVQLLKSTNIDLRNSVYNEQIDDSLLWNYLNGKLKSNLNVRLALVGGTENTRSSMYVLNRKFAELVSGNSSLSKQWRMIDYTSSSELQKNILVGRVVVDETAFQIRQTHPQIDNKIAQIQIWHKRQANLMKSFQQQLLLNEITLLKLWATACQVN